MKKSIACIGSGFVGGSLQTVFSERNIDVYAFDISGKCIPGTMNPVADKLTALLKQKDTSRYNDIVNESFIEFMQIAESNPMFSKIYFVCLPTPMYEDGEADTSIVEDVLTKLASVPGNRIAVVKSTVPPGSTEKWNKKFEATGLRVIFNPEFLTEANALNDMRNQNRIILGGPRPHINAVKLIFQKAFPNVQLIKTSSTTAEMVKYFTNIHLAARVVLSCELSQICQTLDNQGMNVDYDKVVEYAKHDVRLGGTHMSVPGPDGIAGARGHCFPKDLNALIYLAKSIDVNPTVMKGVWSKNLEIVKPEDRDWEKMQGRAVSKKSV